MKEWIKQHCPSFLLLFLRGLLRPLNAVRVLYEYCLIYIQPIRYKRIVRRLRKKETIRIAFFAIHSSVWKYEYLYKLMLQHPRFDPVIVVCPAVNFGMENMLAEMDKCYTMFKQKGYHVVRTYDIATQQYLDVKKEISPDIVFYTNPYRGLIDERYYITNFLDVLTCYVSYNFGNSSFYQMFHNELMHNLVWKLFAETEEHKRYSQLYACNKARNVVVTGYPGVDCFLDRNRIIKDDFWKIKDPSIKRIIWAPHHTFSDKEVVYYSCFLQYSQFMLDMAAKYSDKIQIAFKPHPLLKVKLDNYWGRDRADEYYAQWQTLSNGTLVNDDYVDLFLSSDAMIHDSGSFIVEYLYTLKPVMRTDNGIDITNEFNPFAKECLNLHYHAKNTLDIERFINDIIAGTDTLQEKRRSFYKEKLLPDCDQMPSQNILDVLVKELSE